MLALAQPGHRRPVAGIHQQLEAPHPLQRQNLTRRQQRQGRRQRPIRRLACGRGAGPVPLQPGAAGGAADRFGVEAAITGIIELGLAQSTQREAGEAGVGAGVGLGGGN